jgi:hypothetical protein
LPGRGDVEGPGRSPSRPKHLWRRQELDEHLVESGGAATDSDSAAELLLVRASKNSSIDRATPQRR